MQSIHIPVSVSICNSLTRKVVNIIEDTPKELISKMFDYLYIVHREIRKYNEQKIKSLYTAIEKKKITDNSTWKEDIDQFMKLTEPVRVIGFNSGKYDINTIRNEFFEYLGNQVTGVIKTHSGYMSIKTVGFRFLDICNYVPPGTSYEDYLSTYLGKCKCEDKI